MDILLSIHSLVRWIIVGIAVLAILKFAIGWLLDRPFKGMDRGLAPVAKPRGEFVRTADVIEMAMAANCGHGSFAKPCDFGFQGLQTHAAVDQEIPVAPLNEPHVTAHPWRHMGFENAADTAAHVLYFIPVISDGQHGVRPPLRGKSLRSLRRQSSRRCGYRH